MCMRMIGMYLLEYRPCWRTAASLIFYRFLIDGEQKREREREREGREGGKEIYNQRILKSTKVRHSGA